VTRIKKVKYVFTSIVEIGMLNIGDSGTLPLTVRLAFNTAKSRWVHQVTEVNDMYIICM